MGVLLGGGAVRIAIRRDVVNRLADADVNVIGLAFAALVQRSGAVKSTSRGPTGTKLISRGSIDDRGGFRANRSASYDAGEAL